MSGPPDITLTLVCHREGPLAAPALASMRDMVDAALAAGLTIETRAILDCADAPTRHSVAACGAWLDSVEEISEQDAGLARNAGVAAAAGEFLAFLDGDDLWGEDWLRLAHAAATNPGAPAEAIWHPAFLYYFAESDFDRHSSTQAPDPAAQSFFMVHQSSEDPAFQRDALLLNNVWSANVFAKRTVYRRVPYVATDWRRGIGFEDWSWNLKTLSSGIAHLIVPDTVHLIRARPASLGQQSLVEGLLPVLPETFGFKR